MRDMRYDYRPPKLLRERGEALSEILNRRGMVTYLAGELGISRQAVAQWYAVPEQHIQAVSKLLGIPQYVLRMDKRKVAA